MYAMDVTQEMKMNYHGQRHVFAEWVLDLDTNGMCYFNTVPSTFNILHERVEEDQLSHMEVIWTAHRNHGI